MSKVLFWPKDASGKQENGGASISQRIGQIRYLQEWGMSSARQQQRLKCPQHFLTVWKPFTRSHLDNSCQVKHPFWAYLELGPNWHQVSCWTLQKVQSLLRLHGLTSSVRLRLVLDLADFTYIDNLWWEDSCQRQDSEVTGMHPKPLVVWPCWSCSFKAVFPWRTSSERNNV